ncbi:Rrf2 family transcriptional regulator [Lactobacillus sp. DCY120]|uniref:Rrf2 family transcriptional regulator n=1 Tax=Bombilactobacillus apium TaxID=2675299 RepID=A0A850RAE4_9LACO|nr:Rrf2 family transcriptional regulator [Bombilactobacillus apium]NVY95798.1 Rrf2 family transcriptional regulator [Bombilactobacillus apium]
MKLSNSFLQSIAIIVILAELPDGVKLKSSELSERLEVSHTYLQKIAKKLKDAGLIKSTASKNGGYSLNKKVEDISFYDLFIIAESNHSFVQKGNYDMLYKIFNSENLVTKYGQVAKDIFSDAEESYKHVLNSHSLAEVVPRDSQGKILMIDWQKLFKQSSSNSK